MISEKSGIDKQVILDRMIKEVSNVNHEIDKVVSNDEYLLWIIDFLDENGWCNNDEEIEYFNLDKIEKLENLNYFRDGIVNYAKKNYIYPVKKSFGWCYYIEYNDVIYELAWFEKIGRDVCYFSKVIDKEIKENVIKFDDVLNNRKSINVDFIEKHLDLLSNYIDNSLSLYVLELFDKGIPEEAVIETTNNTFKKMLSRRKKNIK